MTLVGGRARVRPPRELTEDPEAWPHRASDDIGVEAVRAIARHLNEAMAEQQLSLRQVAAGSGVNRQAIANLLAGRSWADVATVARLEAFTGTRLWPVGIGVERDEIH